jgi:hypothetical protein
MKRNLLYLTIILMISFGFAVPEVRAQEKSQTQKEQEQKDKEEKLKQAIEQQKKAMAEQQRKTDEMQKALQEAESQAGVSSGDQLNEFNRRSPRIVIGRDIYDPNWYGSPGIEFYGGGFGGRGGGDTERTTWDFSKYVKESTFTKQYSFDVEKTVGTVVMTVIGDCKAGEIRVKILMPGGKTYSDILIDEFGNLNWRKSFTISEEENKDKTGEWIFKIDAAKATGSFKISLQTY